MPTVSANMQKSPKKRRILFVYFMFFILLQNVKKVNLALL